MSGAHNERWDFRSGAKDDISRHFARSGYVILRPSEFMDDLRNDIQGGNLTIRDDMEFDLGRLVYQKASVCTQLHIGDCPCGELMERERGVDMVNSTTAESLPLGCNGPITSRQDSRAKKQFSATTRFEYI